jgi:hypothetical protein
MPMKTWWPLNLHLEGLEWHVPVESNASIVRTRAPEVKLIELPPQKEG